MSKFCPITQSRVVYLECLECVDRVCEEHGSTKLHVTILPKKEKDTHGVDVDHKSASGSIQAPQNTSCGSKASHPDCNTCCHKCGEHQTTMFSRTFQAIQCTIFHNRIFTSTMVRAEGCEYHNRNISQEKICLNCEYYLGGGDWGLACKADYYKLPSSTDEACGKFKRKVNDGNG